MTHIVIPTSDPVASVTFSGILGIDISAFIDNSDYISFSLPDFPSTKLDLSQTFVDFTSNPIGDFGVGPTDQIAFDQANPALPGSDGDTEMRIPIPSLVNIDKSSITGVRFRIYANSTCTFRCLSIRACSTNWLYAPIDIDTLWNRVHRPPSTDGSVDEAIQFPINTDPAWPKAFPVVWRSDGLTGAKDPHPINVSLGVSFATGTFAEADGSDDDHRNILAFYFRDVPTLDQIMLDLNSENQVDLNTYGAQPDFGNEAYSVRTQQNLDIDDQANLQGDTQFDIERIPDYNTHTWLEVKLKWSSDTASNTLTILNSDSLGYTFTDISLDPTNPDNLDEGQYILLIDLIDDSIRAKIYGISQVGIIDPSNLVFDSGYIKDDTVIKRRKGRFGWWPQLIDGDAYVSSIRTRGLNFGELRTKQFQSYTPVKGASLFAGTTSNKELFQEIMPAPWSTPVTISLDPSASTTGNAYKITSSPSYPLQGIASNLFVLDSVEDLRITFNIKFPQSSAELAGGNITAFLIGDYSQAIPLNLSAFKKDVWSKVRVTLPNELFQTGSYKLILVQTKPIIPTVWWLEDLSIQTTTVKWSARPDAPDAWDIGDDQWIDIGTSLNSLNGGVVFEKPGSNLQIRGQALRQEAVINDFKTVPQYATLGRFVWADEEPSQGYSPTAFATVSNSNLTITASATAGDADGSVVAYLWDFGDDNYDSGIQTTHTYAAAGTYTVTLIVNDDFGNSGAYQSVVTVP